MYNLKEILSYSELTKVVDFIAIDESNANSFGVLEVSNKKVGLAWYGNSKPEINKSNKLKLLLIGAGSTVVFVSTETNMIKFAIGLNNPFAFFLIDEKRIVIASETTLTIVNQNTLSIEQFTGIPDIIIDGRIEDGQIIINGMDKEFKI